MRPSLPMARWGHYEQLLQGCPPTPPPVFWESISQCPRFQWGRLSAHKSVSGTTTGHQTAKHGLAPQHRSTPILTLNGHLPLSALGSPSGTRGGIADTSSAHIYGANNWPASQCLVSLPDPVRLADAAAPIHCSLRLLPSPKEGAA